MPILSRKEVVWNGHRGIVTTSYEAVMQDASSLEISAENGFTIGASNDGSIAHSLHIGRADEAWKNPITGETEFVSYRAAADAYPDLDLNKAFLRIGSEFIPAEDETIYASDMVDIFRQRGWSEAKIQEMLDWETSIRNPSYKE
jgi:hypothetical protein